MRNQKSINWKIKKTGLEGRILYDGDKKTVARIAPSPSGIRLWIDFSWVKTFDFKTASEAKQFTPKLIDLIIEAISPYAESKYVRRKRKNDD